MDNIKCYEDAPNVMTIWLDDGSEVTYEKVRQTTTLSEDDETEVLKHVRKIHDVLSRYEYVKADISMFDHTRKATLSTRSWTKPDVKESELRF